MPNWVYNSIYNYPKDLYEKYKSEDRDIDFDKIIPEPEELKHTVSGSIPELAKKIYKFKIYKDFLESTGEDYNRKIRYDSDNPLRQNVTNFVDRTVTEMGNLAIENPDESLNKILAKDENKHIKERYDKYVNIFGNNRFENCKDYKVVYDKYVKEEEKDFKSFKSKEKINGDIYNKYDSLESYGKHLFELKEKYGYDNWYDWQNANWGTKWNACDSAYNDEDESITFDTAWSIPYPIIAKIAQDNQTVQLDGYSEEETGWFDEYSTKDGKVFINDRGERLYDEEKDEAVENRENLEEPIVFTYEEYERAKKKEEKLYNAITDSIN